MNKVFILVDEDNDIVAAYSTIILAKKMKPVVERKTETVITIVEVKINPDITNIN